MTDTVKFADYLNDVTGVERLRVQNALAGITELTTQYAGWSVVGDRLIQPIGLATTSRSRSSHLGLAVPFDIVAIRAAFANTYVASNTMTPAPNPVQVAWSFEPLGVALEDATGANVNQASTQQHIQGTWGSKRLPWVEGGTLAVSDPIFTPVKAGFRNASDFYQNAYAGPIPAAPVVAPSAGAGIAAGTYAVAVSLVYADGESPGSASAAAVTAGGNLRITVTAPDAATYPNAIGYKTWISRAGQTTPLYESGQGVVPMGTDTILSLLPNVAVATSTRQTSNGNPAACVTGGYTGGGTAPGSANNGEYTVTNLDRTGDGYAASGSVATSNVGPLFYLGLDPTKVHASFGILGDSINFLLNDNGFANGWGGAITRACIGQTTNRYYDPTKPPVAGYIPLAVSGQTAAQIAGAAGALSRSIASFCTDAVNNASTNDFTAGTLAPAALLSIITTARSFTAQGKFYHHQTCTPRVTSSNGFVDVANQSQPANAVNVKFEGAKRQFNNVLRSTATAQQVIANEAMIRSPAATTPATDLYSGGDGVTQVFQTGFPFVAGSERITVNGVLNVLATDYTYLGATTIDGVSYVGGVSFVVAPGNGVAVAASYTGSPGFVSMEGSGKADVWDVASVVEVNANNVLTLNGGWWIAAAEAALVTGTSSGSNTSTTFNDTTKTWTQDQYRGYELRIETDTTTPAAVGQVEPIYSNSPTSLTVSTFTVTPSADATYKIYDPYTADGVHGTPRTHMLEGAFYVPFIEERMAA